MNHDPATLAQVAALAYRLEDDGPRVLLLTSRETGRWVIPKGWPMAGRKPHEAAAREAFEEAGLKGKPGKKPLGSYQYWKRMREHFVLVTVQVFALRVTKQARKFPEAGTRRLEWVRPEEAARRVDEAGLATLLVSWTGPKR